MNNPVIQGLKHLALKVVDINKSQSFYERLFNMRVVWQPDPENVYLSSGTDNLALHQIPVEELTSYQNPKAQLLDHFGFLVDSPHSVDLMFQRVQQEEVTIVHPPKQHRDGSYSFYIDDPDHNTIQILFEPTVSVAERHS